MSTPRSVSRTRSRHSIASGSRNRSGPAISPRWPRSAGRARSRSPPGSGCTRGYDYRELLTLGAARRSSSRTSSTPAASAETLAIAAMAETWMVPVAPHNPNGPVATAATLVVDAIAPNALIQEMLTPWDADWRDAVVEGQPARRGRPPRDPGSTGSRRPSRPRGDRPPPVPAGRPRLLRAGVGARHGRPG